LLFYQIKKNHWITFSSQERLGQRNWSENLKFRTKTDFNYFPTIIYDWFIPWLIKKSFD
jgi:hypothetical protein